jgi:hypothetical protein
VGSPQGFEYTQRKNGEIVIFHRGRLAATLRGSRAEKFMLSIRSGDPQQVMARATGNYKRGNEPRR